MLHCYKTPKNTLGLEFQSQNSSKKEKLIKEEDSSRINTEMITSTVLVEISIKDKYYY